MKNSSSLKKCTHREQNISCSFVKLHNISKKSVYQLLSYIDSQSVSLINKMRLKSKVTENFTKQTRKWPDILLYLIRIIESPAAVQNLYLLLWWCCFLIEMSLNMDSFLHFRGRGGGLAYAEIDICKSHWHHNILYMIVFFI